MSPKNIPGGRTEVSNDRQIDTIDLPPAEAEKDSAPDSISDTEYWLHCNANFDTPNHSEDNREADNESYKVLDNVNEDPETPGQQDVSMTPNVPQSNQPTPRLKDIAEPMSMMVITMETRRNKGIKTK